MSVQLMSRVWEHGPTSAIPRIVLMAIADQAHDTGESSPGIRDIASSAGVSIRTVTNHLQTLEADGWIQVLIRGRRGPGATNLYQINLEKLGITL